MADPLPASGNLSEAGEVHLAQRSWGPRMDIRPGHPDASSGRMTGAQHPYPRAPVYPPGRRSVQAPADVRLGARLWERLEAVRRRAQGAASWLQASSHYGRLINRDGVVPVTARFTFDDLAFLGNARGELLSLAEAGHRPGGPH